MNITLSSEIRGAGFSVPSRVVTNAHFASYLDTSDEWIRDRTGIAERRWVAPGTGASELAEPAARDALRMAGLSSSDIDGIVFATVTPDYVFPSAACFLQRRLGVGKCLAFDVNAVCTGFIYALVTADALIAKGLCQNVLVVGADIFSQLINPNDRTTCILFGDGAGAVVLSKKAASANDWRNESGVYASELHADGNLTDILCVPHGTAKPVTPEALAAGETFLSMAGREVFKHAVRSLVDVSQSVVAKAGFAITDIDFVISHQANKRILSAVGEHLKLAPEKMLSNVERYGNTSAASVPILLAESIQNGVIKKGNLLLLNAVGGGMTWGAVLVRY